MKIAILSSSNLGVSCWSALRATGCCHRCERYETCKLPERVPNEEYDELRRQALALRRASDALYEQSKLI